MRRQFWILFLLLLAASLFLFVNSARSEELACELYSGSEGKIWTYTICKTEPVDTKHILYFFHGAGGDAHTWLTAYKKLRGEWAKSGRAHPVVVAVSFGPKWLLVPNDKASERKLLDIFWNDLIPHVESKLPAPITRRDVIGHSMGGYNALQLALDRPRYFDNVVLLSPVILNLSPYAGAEEICEYAKRTGGYSYKQRLKFLLTGCDSDSLPINKILKTMRLFIPDQDVWKKASILHNASQKIGAEFPRLYMSCGTKDAYGLHEGVRILTDIVKLNGGVVELHLLEGGHMVRDDKSIVEFLR